jgi:hypothetical protein
MGSFGGLYVTGNTTAFLAPNAGAKYTTGWTAFGHSGGDLTVKEDAANSKLTLRPGVYRVSFSASIETEDISGTSGDYAGILTFTIRKDGVAVAGLKAQVNQDAADKPANVAITGLLRVLTTDTGDITVYVASGDANGNDVTIKEAQLVVEKVD